MVRHGTGVLLTADSLGPWGGVGATHRGVYTDAARHGRAREAAGPAVARRCSAPPPQEHRFALAKPLEPLLRPGKSPGAGGALAWPAWRRPPLQQLPCATA
jgi:hypothetical protein